MPEALVGTVGAVTQGVAGAAVTPVWQGNEPRTAGNKLICWVGVTGTATLPTTPAGWNIAKQIAGTSCSSTIYYRDATGGDAAPTIALIASGVIAASLGEYSGLVAGAPEQSGSAATAVSPIVATAGGADGQIGNLMVTNLAAFFSASRSPTLTNTYTNATAVARDNAGTSIANHYSQAYGGPTTANSLADKDSFALGASTSLTGMALVLASFKPMLDVNVSDAVGHTESAATQTLVDNTNDISDAVGVADGPPNITLVHNANGVSDAVGHSESVTVELMPPDQLVNVSDAVGTAESIGETLVFNTAVRDIATVTRENWCPNPSAEYDTLGSAPALWSTATDGFHITAGATATVVSDTNTADASGTKAIELVGNGVSAREGMAIVVTPPGGFKAGRRYVVQMAMRYISGDGNISLELGAATSGTDISSSGAWAHRSVFTSSGMISDDVASATLYIVSTNALAYTWRIDAVLVREQTTGDFNVGATYVDGDTAGGIWAGTAGQSTSLVYGDVPLEMLESNRNVSDAVGVAESTPLLPLLVALPSVSDAVGVAESTGETKVFNAAVRDIATVTRDNWVPNPSFEYDTPGGAPALWSTATDGSNLTAGATATVVSDTNTADSSGTQAVELIGDGLSTKEGMAITVTPPGGFKAGRLYTVQAAVKVISGSRRVHLALVPGPGSNDTTIFASTWLHVMLVAQPVADAASATLYISNPFAAAYVWHIDAVLVREETSDDDRAFQAFDGSGGPYGDGDSGVWAGTPGQSTSFGYGDVVAILLGAVGGALTITTSDAAAAAESIGRLLEALANVSDAVGHSESTGETLVHNAGVSDTVAITLENWVPNPSFEYDALGAGPALWSTTGATLASGATATVVSDTNTVNASGTQALELVGNGASSDEGVAILVTPPGGFKAGVSYQVQLATRYISGQTLLHLELGSTGANSGINTSAGWQQATALTMSFGVDTASATLTIRCPLSTAYVWRIDAVLVREAATSSSYVDGDSTGGAWAGSPGQSTSLAQGDVSTRENALATLVHNALTSDSVSVTESTLELLVALVTTSESVSAAESTLELLLSFIAKSDSIGAAESRNETLVHNPIVSDSVTVSESLAALLVALAAVSDAVGAAESSNETLVNNPTVSDAVSVAENRAQTLVHNASTSDAVTAAEALAELLLSFASVSEAVAVAESIGQTQADNAAVTDTVATSEALTELLVSFIAASETIGGGAGVIAVDASTPAMVSGGGGGSTATSPSFSPPGGSLLLICFANEQGNTSITSITDSLGASLPYSLKKRNSSGAPNAAEIWIAQVPSTAPGSMTVTVHSSGSVSFGSLAVIVLTGAADASLQGTSATASGGSGAALPSASYTATADGSIGFAVIVNSNDNTGPTIPAGQTDVFNGHTDFHNGTIGSSWVQATTTGASAGATVTVNDTAPSTNFLEALVEIAPSSVGSITESTKETLISPVAASDSVGVAESTKELLEALAAVSDAAAAAEFTNETLVDNAAVSEAITAAEAVSELLQSFVVTTDSVSVTESNIAAVQGLLAVIETVGVSESTQELLASFAAASDSVNTAESTNETLVDNTAVSDAVSLAEAVAETLVHNAAVSDSATVDESVLELLLSFIAASESISATEAANVLLVLLGVLTASVSDSVTVSESTDELLGILIAALDSPIVSESTLELLVSFVAATDAAAASEATNETLVHNASVSDPVTATELAASLLVSLISQSESVTASENLAELLIAFIASSESVSVSDDDFVVLSVLGAIVLAIQENVGVDEAASAALLALITVSDAPTLSESAQAALSVALAVTDATNVAEALILRPESFVAVLDALTASDSVAASLANTIAALEAVAVAESSSSSLSIAALVAEGINVLDAASALLVSLVATSDGAAVGDAIALTLASTIAISEALTVQDASSIDALLLTVAVSQAITAEDDLLISLLAVLVAGILTSTTSAAMLTSESAEAVMLTSTQQRAATLDTKLS